MAAQEVAQFLVRLGVLDVVLPFILVFTLVLALLERTRVLGTEKGKPKRRLNAMVAFVLAFFSIVSLQEVIAIRAFGEVTSVAVIVVLVLLMTVGMLGASVPNKLLTWSGVGICVIGALVVLDRLGLLPERIQDVVSSVWGPPFAIIVALFCVGWFIFREKPEQKGQKKGGKDGATIEPDKVKPKGPGGMMWTGKD
jgi:hypothetical protein